MKRLLVILFTYFFIFLLLPKSVEAIEFEISNPVINQNEIEVDINLSNVTNVNCPNSRCYLQGMLRSSSGSQYFGSTKNNDGQWIEYISSPEPVYIQNNFFNIDIASNSWSGKLTIQFSSNDSKYVGPGDYDLKVKRYTGNSSSGSESGNTLVIHLELPTPTPTFTPTTAPTPTPTATPTVAPTPVKTVTPKPTVKPSQSPSSAPEVLGEKTSEPISTDSPTPTQSPEPKLPLPIIPMVLIGLGIISIGIPFYPVIKKFYLTKFKRYNDSNDKID